MKAIVKTKFIDKNTKKARNVGDIFSCSKERFAEIKAAGEQAKCVYAEEYTEQPEQK